MTKKYLTAVLLILIVWGCNSNSPNVNAVKVELQTLRFEQALFKADSNNMSPALTSLQKDFNGFTTNFIGTILNADSNWAPTETVNYLRSFMGAYRAVYDSSQLLYKNFDAYAISIKKGLQHVKFYFPNYPLPSKLITYVGPLDGYGDILDTDAIVVGLHHHLGAKSTLYQPAWVQDVYPAYISSRFTSDYIAINAMKNIVLDLYPENSSEKSLVVQMVEKGKRLYLLERFLPETAPHLLLGYTKKQYDESMEREATIWALFIQNNLLQTTDYNMVKNYIGDGPKTQELGDASPGNIGSFAGWQIVKTYIKKHPNVSPDVIMKLDAEQLFAQAKYKP